jgi:hypothetical protein
VAVEPTPEAATDGAPEARDERAADDAALDGAGLEEAEAGSEVGATLDALEEPPPLRDSAPPQDAPRSCFDNVKDGDESDVDCGGSCPPCGLDQACRSSADCGKWPGCDPVLGCACDTLSNICVFNHCSDHVRNDGETSVDCGGGACPGCGPGKECVTDGDCSATLTGCDADYGGCRCDALSMTCVYDHCYDHKQDVDESDVDCGGDRCSGCKLGQHCLLDGDCASRACDGLAQTCDSSQCSDHRQDGDETDVDCGGSICSIPCPQGGKCKLNTDCQTGFCSTGIPHLCL